jgi:hypothetical protein
MLLPDAVAVSGSPWDHLRHIEAAQHIDQSEGMCRGGFHVVA